MDLKERLRRTFLFILGTFFFVLAIIGAIVPLLPTTPFIILATICYIRSSNRLYSKLVSTKVYKRTIANMVKRRGMTIKAKALILIPVWCMLLFMFFTVDSYILKGLALFLGILKTIVFLYIKTTTEDSFNNSGKEG